VRVDLRGEAVHLGDELVHLGNSGFAYREVFALVHGTGSVFGDVNGLAFFVALEGFDAQLFDQRVETSLVRGDPLATDFDGGSVHVLAPGASAYAVTCLEYGYGFAGLAKFVGCGETR